MTGFVAIIVTIGVLSHKQTAHFVFVEVENFTGWPSNGLAWMIGMLSTAFSFLG